MSASGQSWPQSCLEFGVILDNFWSGHLGMVVLGQGCGLGDIGGAGVSLWSVLATFLFRIGGDTGQFLAWSLGYGGVEGFSWPGCGLWSCCIWKKIFEPETEPQ